MPHGGADNTQKILDVLADYGVKATFFVVGNWADQYPEQAKAIVDSGCELMNHSILEMSRNVQSGNTQNLKSSAASDQAAVCACAHSWYFTGGSPSGLRV
ncbi:MAG: polysaccharide deacetylase family protein [Oscillospiraceae bacterium]